MIRHYCVYTQDPLFHTVLKFLCLHDLTRTVHLNRTRFWIDDELPLHSELVLRFCSSIVCIDCEQDHALGV
jgi:hypothetical protein